MAMWLIPILCFMGFAIHHALFALVYMPFVLVLLLYSLYKSSFSKTSIIFTTLNFFTIILSAIYFFIFSKRTIAMSVEKISEYLSSKAHFPIMTEYFGFNFLGKYNEYSADSVMELIKTRFSLAFEGRDFSLFSTFIMYTLPLLICLFIFWNKAAQLSNNTTGKFFMRLCSVVPFASLIALFFSTDMDRFFSQIIIVQFCLIFYLIYDKNEAVMLACKQNIYLFRKYPLVFVFVFILYLTSYPDLKHLLFRLGTYVQNWS